MNIIKQTDESKKLKMSQSCFWMHFLTRVMTVRQEWWQ